MTFAAARIAVRLLNLDHGAVGNPPDPFPLDLDHVAPDHLEARARNRFRQAVDL